MALDLSRSGLLLTVFLHASCPEGARGGSLAVVAGDLARSAREAGFARVAVLPLSPADDSPVGQGRILSEMLLTSLVRENGVQVVERSLVDRLLEEQRITDPAHPPASTRGELARLLAVDAIVTGSFLSRGAEVVVNIGKFIQFLNQLDPVTAMSYWRKDSRLIAKNIVTPTYPYRGKMTVPDALFLETSVLDQVLGKKVHKSSPTSRCLPAALSEKLGEYVVGQDHARRTIATGVYKHQQICRLNKERKGVDRLQRANIFLIGPTGTGKTHLCRTLAKVLNVPFVICDATQYTETGYVGANVEEMLVALSKQAGQKGVAQQGGIIFIDEIDKIAQRRVGPSHNSNRDVSGLSVQTELLKLLDGDIVHYQNVDYDVSKILFIAGGAFSGLEDIITARQKEHHIGFSTGREPNACAGTQSLKDAGPEDIMAYGFMPEFMGRFASIVALDGLGKSELVDIMTKPRNNLLSQYQALFKASGIDLRIPQTALEWVADQALLNRTGARGLKAILETHLSPILFEQSSAVYGRKAQSPLKEVSFDPTEYIN